MRPDQWNRHEINPVTRFRHDALDVGHIDLDARPERHAEPRLLGDAPRSVPGRKVAQRILSHQEVDLRVSADLVAQDAQRVGGI